MFIAILETSTGTKVLELPNRIQNKDEVKQWLFDSKLLQTDAGYIESARIYEFTDKCDLDVAAACEEALKSQQDRQKSEAEKQQEEMLMRMREKFGKG